MVRRRLGFIMLWLLGLLNVLGAIVAISYAGWSGLTVRSLVVLGLGTLVSIILPLAAQRSWKYTLWLAWALAVLYIISRLVVSGGAWREAFSPATIGQQIAFAVMTVLAAIATQQKTISQTGRMK